MLDYVYDKENLCIKEDEARVEAKLISTTNNKFDYIIGRTGILEIKLNFSAKFLNYEKFLITSIVKSFEVKEKILTIKTLNSIYVFEILNC